MKTMLFTMLVAYIQPVHFLKLNIVGVRINGLIFLSNLMSSSNSSFQHGVFVRSIELKKNKYLPSLRGWEFPFRENKLHSCSLNLSFMSISLLKKFLSSI